MRKIIFAVIPAVLFSALLADTAGPAKLIDARDRKVYKTFMLGEKKWMAENLNFKTAKDSWCYNDSAENCKKFGRMYTWDASKKACPEGWHLAADSEFKELLAAAGEKDEIVKNLLPGGKTGFNAMMAGNRYRQKFGQIDNFGFWWSSTGDGTGDGLSLMVSKKDNAAEIVAENLKNGFYVRCVSDK